tara:strand:- start:7398 stop:7772 length:375 start_codon:yes stop_codon:yes gene_type:complete
MSKLEVFQNGVFSSTGEPVFQIGSKNADGTYTATVFELMTKAQAEAKLNEVQPSVPKKEAPKKEAPKKTAAKRAAKLKVPSKEELTGMSKDTLEIEMRKHGLELDRRKTKDTLVKQAVSFLKGK